MPVFTVDIDLVFLLEHLIQRGDADSDVML